jgi:hypothetical protein
MTEMHADYDSNANALSIVLGSSNSADRADQAHERAIVALRADRPVEVQILYPDLGIDEPLQAVIERYDLDVEGLTAAAQAAIAAPDRAITLSVAMRTAA